MERSIPERVQPTTWGVGEKLKGLLEGFRIRRIVNNLDSLRDSKLPDQRTVSDGPMASVTIQKNWPDRIVIINGQDNSDREGSAITITALWGQDDQVIGIEVTSQEFIDGQEINTVVWSTDHLSGVQSNGMSTSEVAGQLRKASRVLRGSLKPVPAAEQEDY